jgi:hypothetical protein
MFSGAPWGLLLLAACSGTSAPGGPTGTTMVPDAGPAGPFDITIASSPPIELPGTVLWLDANFGVARDAAQVRAWTDRSGLGLIFEREGTGDPGPTGDRLSGHGALHFGGHARMTLSGTVEPPARAALTLGAQDFLIALLLRRDAGGPDPILFALVAPEVASPLVLLQVKSTLEFTLGPATVTTSATLEGVHLVVAARQGGALRVRVDGQEVGSSALATPPELPFLIPAVGGEGFAGVIGDVVVVAGEGVEAAAEPLEAYLRQKYGL